MSDVAVQNSDSQIQRIPSLDKIEVMILEAGGHIRGNGPEADIFPETHSFTPGLYIRELFMPAGSVLTSRTHVTEHPYVVSQGRATVYSEVDGVREVVAPLTGITKAGTKRLLFIHEDMTWTTFHVTDLTDVEEIEKVIFAPWVNEYIVRIRAEGVT